MNAQNDALEAVLGLVPDEAAAPVKAPPEEDSTWTPADEAEPDLDSEY